MEILKQGYLAELLVVERGGVDVDVIRRIFWMIKVTADFCFLRQPFIVPNLIRLLKLTKDDLAAILNQNCHIREQVMHCFLKYIRRGHFTPGSRDPGTLSFHSTGVLQR